MNREEDQEIRTVLQALQRVEPQPGMQARLLTALQKAEAERMSPVRSPWRIGLVRPVLPWLAAASLLLVAAGTALLHHAGQVNEVENSQTASRTDAGEISTRTVGKLARPEGFDSQVPFTSSHRLSGRQAGKQSRSLHESTSTAKVVLEPSAEAEGKSFPPPPLPLTEQERLLLRLARHEPPLELAHLTKPARDAAFERGREQVNEFFAPPPVQEQQEAPEPVPDLQETPEPTNQQ